MDWPLLSALSEEERRRVLVMARRRRFARQEVIFHDGDPGDTLHLIGRRLEELADAFHIEGETTVQLPLKQEEIAQIVGTTRPTINRLLRAAEEAGIVRVTRGQLEVLDRDSIAARA